MQPLTSAEVESVRDSMLGIAEAVRGFLERGRSPLDAVDMVFQRAGSSDLQPEDHQAMIAVLIVMLAGGLDRATTDA